MPNVVLAFTLIELLIVIGLIGVLLALVLGGLSRASRTKWKKYHEKVSSACEELAPGSSKSISLGKNDVPKSIGEPLEGENWRGDPTRELQVEKDREGRCRSRVVYTGNLNNRRQTRTNGWSDWIDP